MPEYLAPGVYIEETSYRTKSIEGVSTSTAGFIGPCAFGPSAGEPELLTSFADYQRIYGGLNPLSLGGSDKTNYLAHAVRAFFEEGGSRLYVMRVAKDAVASTGPVKDGDTTIMTVSARYGGVAADGTSVGFTFRVGKNALGKTKADPGNFDSADVNVLRGLREYDTVLYMGTVTQEQVDVAKAAKDTAVEEAAEEAAKLAVIQLGKDAADADVTAKQQAVADAAGDADAVAVAEAELAEAKAVQAAAVAALGIAQADKTAADQAAATATATHGTLNDALGDKAPRMCWVESYLDAQQVKQRLVESAGNKITLDSMVDGDSVRPVTVTVNMSGMGQTRDWEGLAIDPRHANSMASVFAVSPEDRATALYVPLTMAAEAAYGDGAKLATALLALDNPSLAGDDTLFDALVDDTSSDAKRSFKVFLAGGSDGSEPGTVEYQGSELAAEKTGFKSFEDVENISIVAAPGSTALSDSAAADAVTRLLISHCERMRYRVAVLDSYQGKLISEVLEQRGSLDSTHAALYYPWVKVQDPVTRKPIDLPPSGFVAGIYARNDVDNGVHKAPANEVVRLATGFETLLNKGQQDVLNPEGVNCFRFFEGRGFRLWGARTISSDSEWKYVNVRRYFAYLERSIEKGTQWVVFENNHDPLWARVRRTIEDFLFNEWKNGRIMGRKPDEAYFVRCDRSTMTQNDIDNGRLVCEVGIAPVKPAEFVIFRIGQWTADAQA